MSNVYAAFDFSAPGFIQLLIRKLHPSRACFVRTRKRLTTNEHEWTLIKRERTTDTTNIVGRLCQTLACSHTGMSETTDYIDRTDWGADSLPAVCGPRRPSESGDDEFSNEESKLNAN